MPSVQVRDSAGQLGTRQLPGTNVSDGSGYQMWGYEGYSALPPVDLEVAQTFTVGVACWPMKSFEFATSLAPMYVSEWKGAWTESSILRRKHYRLSAQAQLSQCELVPLGPLRGPAIYEDLLQEAGQSPSPCRANQSQPGPPGQQQPRSEERLRATLAQQR